MFMRSPQSREITLLLMVLDLQMQVKRLTVERSAGRSYAKQEGKPTYQHGGPHKSSNSAAASSTNKPDDKDKKRSDHKKPSDQ